MGKNKVIGGVVLVLVIIGAVVVIVRQQSGSGRPPAEVLARPVKLIQTEKPFEVKTFTTAEAMDAAVDPATGYRKIGDKSWATIITCSSCGKEIPEAPVKAGSTEPPQLGKYMCPICGKPAYQVE